MDNIEKSLILDPYMIQVITWLLVFLFSSLVAIIVWIAKVVWSGLENIKTKLEVSQNQSDRISDNMTHIRGDIEELYKKLEDIPDLSNKITGVEISLVRLGEDMNTVKTENSAIFRRLAEVEKVSALHNQWIRLRGGDPT